MDNKTFIEKAVNIFNRTVTFYEKARREGLFSIENDIDKALIDERDIFEYGIRWVIDGTDPYIINKILSNLIAQCSDPLEVLLKTIQKEAVLGTQAGENFRIMLAYMTSYINNSDILEIKNIYRKRLRKTFPDIS